MPKQEFRLREEDDEMRREQEYRELERQQARKVKDARRRDAEDYVSQKSRPERAR